MDFLSQFVRGIAQAWQRLSASARINIILAALATVVMIAAAVVIGSRPEYIDLYRGLSREDSSAIISLLEDRGISYKTEADGRTVRVPARLQQQVRVDLAQENLPKSHGGLSPGFELLDRQNIMTNQWLQDVNYKRAVEGELQRFLMQFDFIKRAAVHISEAKEELFASSQKPSEAAVSIEVTRSPSRAEIKALLSIISSFGGANLDQRHITLTAFDGTALYLPPADEFASLANSQLQYIHELESQREDRARKALAEMGINAVVKVSAEVDFTSTTEKMDQALEGVPLSESSVTTTLNTTESLPEGPVGATQNIPEGTVRPGGTRTEESVEDTITNYQTSSKIIEKKIPAGAVKRYIVSAAIEGAYGEPDAQGKRPYTPTTEETRATVKQMILAAVGPGVKPADITVSDHPFLTAKAAAQIVTATPATAPSLIETVVNYGATPAKALLLIIAFFVVRSMLLRAIARPGAEEEEEEEVLDVGELRRRQVADNIERLSTDQPDAAAALLRTWLHEGKD